MTLITFVNFFLMKLKHGETNVCFTFRDYIIKRKCFAHIVRKDDRKIRFINIVS